MSETEQPEQPGPIPEAVRRRERHLVLSLLAVITVLSLVGFFTIPSEDELMETASTHAEPLVRVRAMNALIYRGYWKDKAFKDFERFNKSGPPEIPQFLADMHGDLLKSDRRAWKK